jgi:hypothetical protein
LAVQRPIALRFIPRRADFGDGPSSKLGDFLWAPQLPQSLEGCENDIEGIRAAQRLAENVAHASGLYDSADAPAGNDAGSTGGWTKEHLRTSMPGLDLVRDGHAYQGYRLHILARARGAFADGIGNAARFAHADAYLAIVISDDDNGAEAKTTSTLEDFGYTSNVDDAFVQFVAIICSASPRIPIRSASFH